MQVAGENPDLPAIKRLLDGFRDRVQILDADLCSFYRALDGPPGTIAQLADELHDRETRPADDSPAWPESIEIGAEISV